MQKLGKILALFFLTGTLVGCSWTIPISSEMPSDSNESATSWPEYPDYLFEVREDKKSWLVANYFGSEESVNIPASVQGLPVVEIKTLAFDRCSKLSSVNIPDSVTQIDSAAFNVCVSLSTVSIPSTIAVMGPNPFLGCDALTYRIKDNFAYLGNGTDPYLVLAKFGNKDATSITVPDGTSIICDTFDRFANLTYVKIPRSVIWITSWAFRDCPNLPSFDFAGNSTLTVNPEKTLIMTADGSSLVAVSGAESIVVPDSVRSIGEDIFSEDVSLVSISLPSSLLSIGMGAFSTCKKLASITIPSKVTLIDQNAFFECYALPRIFIPASVSKIGSSAFGCCSSLAIFCEATKQPSTWNSNWNPDNRPVTWGATK